MKVATTGLEITEGKIKYDDPIFNELVKKFKPAKQSPYYFEIFQDRYDAAQAIVITEDHILDLLILDMEKVETRLTHVEDDQEKELLERCQIHLEKENPLCDMHLNEAEQATLHSLGFLSYKPTLVMSKPLPNLDVIFRLILEKAGLMFFYTSGPEEVHAWLIKQGAQAVTCAGKIHSDLARGFIKAEIIHYDQLISAHSFSDARKLGLTQLVDRDYSIPNDTVLEIRFKV
jgi:ribosome-binding ATPase